MAIDPPWVFEVYKIFEAAGVPPDVWVPVMIHESNGHPNATNDTRGKPAAYWKEHPGLRPEFSIGLFQWNVAAMFPNDLAAQDAMAARLYDPIENAKMAAARMGPTWAAIKSVAEGTDPGFWSGNVGIRTAWPRGPDKGKEICDTDYCLEIVKQFHATWKTWHERWANDGFDLRNIITWKSSTSNQSSEIDPAYKPPAGLPGMPANPLTQSYAPGSGGQSAYNSVTTAPGYFNPGSSGGGFASGGSSASATAGVDLGGIAAGTVKAAETQLSKDFRAWLASPAAKTFLFFVAGAVLVVIALVAIMFENSKRGIEWGNRQASALTKTMERAGA